MGSCCGAAAPVLADDADAHGDIDVAIGIHALHRMDAALSMCESLPQTAQAIPQWQHGKEVFRAAHKTWTTMSPSPALIQYHARVNTMHARFTRLHKAFRHAHAAGHVAPRKRLHK